MDDGSGVWRFPEDSGRQGRVKRYCCNVICGAPTTSEYKASVTPYRIALTDVRRRTKFSIRSSPSACFSCPFLIRRCPFLIRMRSLLGKVRSIRRKVLCMFKSWNGLHRKKASAGSTVAMRWHAFLFGFRAFLVLYLSSSLDVRWTWTAAKPRPDMQRVNRRCSGHWPYVQRTITDKERMETDE